MSIFTLFKFHFSFLKSHKSTLIKYTTCYSTNNNVPSERSIKTENLDKAKTENKAELNPSSDETMERVYDSDHDQYLFVPKTKT